MPEVIEEASLPDAEEILSLQKRAYQSEAAIYSDYCIPPLVQTLTEIKVEFKDHVFLKAVVSNEVVGSVRAQCIEGTCHIGRLIVNPEHQGRGLGKRLMAAIETRFEDVTQFHLFTGHKSEKNLSLYKKLGYSEVRREKIAPNLYFVYLSKNNRLVGV